MNNDVMLSTSDNPFDPFTKFDDWLRYDTEKGYNSCGLLARIAKISSELSDEDNDIEINDAIERIMKLPVKEAENDKIRYIKVTQPHTAEVEEPREGS